jgi:hypothetical protein
MENAHPFGKRPAMKHPSTDLIEMGRRQMNARGKAQQANQRYRSLSLQFRSESEFDSFGLTQQVLDLDQPGGLLPLAPPTARGRIGMVFIRKQAQVLWWLVRAIQVRDQALRSAHQLLRHHQTRHEAMEQRVIALESRLKDLEEKSDGT